MNSASRHPTDGAPVLAVSTTWPPMAAGSGRAFEQLISGVRNLVALVPRSDPPGSDEPPHVRRVLRFASRSGGPLKIYTLGHHAEALAAPLAWTIVHRRRPDVVLCSVALCVGVGGWLLHWLARVPYLVYAQGEELSGPLRGGRFGRARFHITRVVLRRAAAIVCISRFTLEMVRDQYGIGSDRLHLFLPTVDPAEARPDRQRVRRLRADLAPAGPMVLMVGRLAQRRKGFDRAIEALPQVVATHPNARLVVTGPGDRTELIQFARQTGVADSVVFTGEVDRETLIALYAACDVFLLPNRTMPDGDTEGFGVVFLEANLMGKPAVGGHGGGTADAVLDQQTGLLVDGDRPDAIAAAVLKLLNDPERAALLGRQGRARVLQDFSPAARQQAFDALVATLRTRGSQAPARS